MSDWYLFDPEDPARAEQVMQQLRSDGTTLVVERGTFAGWEIVESQSMATPLAVQWAIEGRLAEARERGLASESDPYVVIDRLSARHPELEAAIEAIDVLYSTQGHAALAVYADFLQAKGDPRGTLAMLQLRDPYDRAALEWLADHRVQLFGPLAASTSSDLPKFRWTGGFITGVAGATDVPLATVLRLPACASLRSLQGTWRTVRDGLPHCRATLRRLVLDELAGQSVELGELPKLDELVLRLDGGSPRALSLASVRVPKLFVDVFAEDLTTICELLDASSLGPLERFGFRIPWRSRPEHLRALLGHRALHSLREIALIWDTPTLFWDLTRDYVPVEEGPLDGPLLDVLLEAPLMHRVELRDLWELDVRDPKRVEDAFASAPGRTLTRP